MKHARFVLLGLTTLCLSVAIGSVGARPQTPAPASDAARRIDANARRMLDDGRRIFRYETFGDEAFWTDTLHLNRAIAGSKFGGVGDGVSPKTALSVGLKVDMDAVPADVAAALKAGRVNLDDPASTMLLLKANAAAALKAGRVNLDDPASTMLLLKANAVVGVTGRFDANGNM